MIGKGDLDIIAVTKILSRKLRRGDTLIQANPELAPNGAQSVVNHYKQIKKERDNTMWPYLRGLFGFNSFYSMFDSPRHFSETTNPWQKRSRSHSGDHTRPKGKISKHRKFIKKMARL